MLKKYTFIRLVGGLGNQLFIYAFGLAYSKKNKTNLVIDNISGFGKRDYYGGVFSLNGYNIKEKFIDQSIFKYLVANRYFWYVIKKLKILYIEKNNTEFIENIWNIKAKFFLGYWQSFKYFHEYRDILKENLILSGPKKTEIQPYEDKILKAKNPVAIGMRFYEANPDNENIYKVYDHEYYKKAIDILESKEDDLTYFVFSVNIERAKKVLSFKEKDIVFVNPLKEMSDAKFDLYLMSLCKHFIISNSTMYWWSAYLGEKDGSHVVTPKIGFINKDTLLANWIKI